MDGDVVFFGDKWMITVTTNLCDKILEHKLGQVVEVKLERYMEQTTMSEVELESIEYSEKQRM